MFALIADTFPLKQETTLSLSQRTFRRAASVYRECLMQKSVQRTIHTHTHKWRKGGSCSELINSSKSCWLAFAWFMRCYESILSCCKSSNIGIHKRPQLDWGWVEKYSKIPTQHSDNYKHTHKHTNINTHNPNTCILKCQTINGCRQTVSSRVAALLLLGNSSRFIQIVIKSSA